MGEQNVRPTDDEAVKQAFMKSLLDEVQALEYMLDSDMIESGKLRIGAEQEMFLINRADKPALAVLDILDSIEDDRFTPSGFIHAGCAPDYFEAPDVADRVGHFCSDLAETERAEIIAALGG